MDQDIKDILVTHAVEFARLVCVLASVAMVSAAIVAASWLSH